MTSDFEEAMKLGLLANVAAEPAPEQTAPAEAETAETSGGLTPDKFEDALLKGLFGD